MRFNGEHGDKVETLVPHHNLTKSCVYQSLTVFGQGFRYQYLFQGGTLLTDLQVGIAVGPFELVMELGLC